MPPVELPAPDNNPAPIPEPAPKAEVKSEPRNAALDALMNGEKVEPPAPKPDIIRKPVPKKQAKNAPPPPEPENSDDDSEEAEPEEDRDLDAPIVDEEPSEEEEEEPPVPDETMAVKLAKENGKRAKKAEAEKAVLETDLATTRTKLREAEQQLKELKAVKVKPEDDPEFKRMQRELQNGVKVQAKLIPGAKGIPENFTNFTVAYLEAKGKSGAEFDSAMDALKLQIIEKCGNFDAPYDEMHEEEAAKADTLAASVLQLIVNNSSKTEEFWDYAGKLTNDTEFGQAVVQEREYAHTVSRLKPDIDALGDIDPEIVTDNPHSIEAILVGAMEASPAARQRSEDAKDEILAAFTGPKPLTRQQIDKLKAQGTNIKDFEAARAEKHAAKVRKIIQLAYTGAMLRGVLPGKLKAWMELEAGAEREDREDAVLRKVVKKPAPKREEAPVRPSQRQGFGLGRFA